MNEKPYAVHPDLPGLKVPLFITGGAVSLKSWSEEPGPEHIGLLVYDSGEAGTHSIYQIDLGVVIDIKEAEVIGEAIYRRIPRGDSPETSQPRWSWHDDKVVLKNLPFDSPKSWNY